MRKRSVLLVALLSVLLLLPAAVAWADGPDGTTSGDGTIEWASWTYDGSKPFVGEDVTIKNGEVFTGSLGVFDGDLAVEQGGIVNGDVFVSGGDARIDGRINGSLAVIGGDLRMAASGYVSGDVFGMSSDQDVAGHVSGNLTAMSGETVLRSSAVIQGNVLGWHHSVQREPGATVKGQELQGLNLPEFPPLPVKPELPRIIAPEVKITPPVAPRITPPTIPQPRVPQWSGQRPQREGRGLLHVIGRLFGATFSSLMLIAVGALIVVIWPRQTQRVSDCMAALPLRSLGLGLLTFLIAVALEVVAALLVAVIAVIGGLLSATVILIPVGVLLILLGLLLLLPVPLGLLGGMILGWVALAEWVGRKILTAIHSRSVKPLGAVVVGLAVTIWLPALLSVLQPCCIAWPLVTVLLTSFGLGAVVLTRFGTRPCFPAPGSPAAGAGAAAPSAPAGEALPPQAMDDEAGQPDVPPAG